ncbi:Vgb family protein [Paraferrimonas sedimenticola]|uniref:Virginiamycin B lyase n=1 Tax=Paraferrimonas sedimenticola TaxID=375674 RepID=A0AA37RWG4_9GAMM|nr:lyase [Paraferrimonas sedimenticola]GLP96209.1 hypothetical protein GCM10007895_15150 [Paraferrimonas sedimenticola]
MKPVLSALVLAGASLLVTSPLTANEPTAADKQEQAAASQLMIQDWAVEWGGRPRDPFVAPDGHIWFCGQAGNYIAKLDPKSGEMTRYEIPESTHPHNLIVDADGMVWMAGNRDGYIGKFDPATGKTERFDMPEGVKDPHTLVFDAKGDIWFTAQHSNVAGKLEIATGKVSVVKMDTENSRPYGIKIAPNGDVWVALLGADRLVKLAAADLAKTEFPMPRAEIRTRRLEIDSKGQIWYLDYRGGKIGRYQPDADKFDEWNMPNGKSSLPYGTAIDSQDRIWIAETGVMPNQMVGFDTKTQQVISTTPVEAGGSVRHMYFDPQRDQFWFGIDTGFVAVGNVPK